MLNFVLYGLSARRFDLRLLLVMTFRTDEWEVLDVDYFSQVYVETGGVEPLITGVTSDHLNRLRLVANTVQLVRITIHD